MLRGAVQLAKEPPKSFKLNLNMLEQVYRNPQEFTNLFAENIVKFYRT
jgi:hypothetical protein